MATPQINRDGQPEEPLLQIAEILACGLIRVVAGKSSQIFPLKEESSLDISATESGHAVRKQRRRAND